MSAPPEVVFNTATDPDRVSAWLPPPLRHGRRRPPDVTAGPMRARWISGLSPGWSAQLQVHQIPAGGAKVRLDLEADRPDQRLTEIAHESLASLAREVADNLTAS
jgi:hypothetical protein